MTVIEKNKLIAEFDGWEFFPGKRKQQSKWVKPGISWKGVEPPEFNHNWELLMPVVEKIKNCTFYNSGYLHDCFIHYTISVAFEEIVQFIQWYNSTLTNKTIK